MDDSKKGIVEYYISNNLPVNFDLDKATNMLSDLLDEHDRVLYYIPGSKISSEMFFTRKKMIIAQRFAGEWGGDIHLPYKDIHNLKIQRQNKLFFRKLDLMVKLSSITFYIKKSEVENFKKLMWDVFEIQ
jgi:hypothetical protein